MCYHIKVTKAIELYELHNFMELLNERPGAYIENVTNATEQFYMLTIAVSSSRHSERIRLFPKHDQQENG